MESDSPSAKDVLVSEMTVLRSVKSSADPSGNGHDAPHEQPPDHDVGQVDCGQKPDCGPTATLFQVGYEFWLDLFVALVESCRALSVGFVRRVKTTPTAVN